MPILRPCLFLFSSYVRMQEANKSSVMNLELQDYERTITTLESRIAERDRKVAEATELYEKQASICDGFKRDVGTFYLPASPFDIIYYCSIQKVSVNSPVYPDPSSVL